MQSPNDSKLDWTVCPVQIGLGYIGPMRNPTGFTGGPLGHFFLLFIYVFYISLSS